jgi:hypothetical protein
MFKVVRRKDGQLVSDCIDDRIGNGYWKHLIRVYRNKEGEILTVPSGLCFETLEQAVSFACGIEVLEIWRVSCVASFPVAQSRDPWFPHEWNRAVEGAMLCLNVKLEERIYHV